MQTRGEGVKNPENFADVICTWPLAQKHLDRNFLGQIFLLLSVLSLVKRYDAVGPLSQDVAQFVFLDGKCLHGG